MYYDDTRCLDKLLTKYNANKDRPDRPLSSLSEDETRLLMDLRTQIYEMNILLLEIIFINNMLKLRNIPQVYYLERNFWRMTGSVIRQRDKAIKLRYALTKIPLTPEEVTGFKQFHTNTNNRIKYLRETIIPENLAFTPVKEYLEITGEESFIKVIYNFFNNDRKAIYAASQNSQNRDLLDHVLKVVGDAGKLDASRERLEEYVRIDQARSEKIRMEARQEKIESDLYDSEAGLARFQRIFNNSIMNRDDCYDIRIKRSEIISRLMNGKANYYIILCSYMFHSKYMFRYVSSAGTLVPEFCRAALYKEEGEARAVMEQLQEKHPGRAFDVRKLVYME